MQVTAGVMANESSLLLTRFFRLSRRQAQSEGLRHADLHNVVVAPLLDEEW